MTQYYVVGTVDLTNEPHKMEAFGRLTLLPSML